MSSYRVVHVTKRGKLEVAERPLVDPSPGQVRIRVEACGVCHSDALAVEGLLPNAEFPRVPGHEAIGRIDALGAGVTSWTIGQRVDLVTPPRRTPWTLPRSICFAAGHRSWTRRTSAQDADRSRTASESRVFRR